jgi:glucuronate isomerase
MGVSVAEYFAQKEACAHCVEHGDEDHCVTTLLSRAENCFFYNAVHLRIGDYTNKQREAVRNIRDSLSEEALVNYYTRGENLIEKMNLMSIPFNERHDIMTRINYKYIDAIIQEMMTPDKTKVFSMVDNMLTALETEFNI